MNDATVSSLHCVCRRLIAVGFALASQDPVESVVPTSVSLSCFDTEQLLGQHFGDVLDDEAYLTSFESPLTCLIGITLPIVEDQ